MVNINDGIEGNAERQERRRDELDTTEKRWKWIVGIVLIHVFLFACLVLYKSISSGYALPIINTAMLVVLVIWNLTKLCIGKVPKASFRWYIIDITCLYVAFISFVWVILTD